MIVNFGEDKHKCFKDALELRNGFGPHSHSGLQIKITAALIRNFAFSKSNVSYIYDVMYITGK